MRFAFNGIREACIHERNFRIHLMVAIVVIGIAIYFRIEVVEWLFLLFAIQAVIITELINSVIERIIDYVKPEIHPKAKIIKDMAASIVLVSAIFAVIVGIIIFIPKLINL